MLNQDMKFLKICSEAEHTKTEEGICKSELYKLYKSGKEFRVSKGRIVILKKEKNMIKFREITKMIIALLFVAGAVTSFFVEVNQVGEELVRLATVAILAYYFGGSTIAARLRGSR